MQFEWADFLQAFLYLGVPLPFAIFYLQYRWAKESERNIQVLVVKAAGGSSYQLVPKEGGSIQLENKTTGTIKVWPINELATTEIAYPGVAYVPRFMQKTIRLGIVDEEDWEPLLNRSPHQTNIMSPDIVEFLKEVAELSKDKKLKDRIKTIVENTRTAPTRAMIASPAVLGNLLHEKITEAIMTVNKEALDKLTGIVNKMSKMLTMPHYYIGIGALAVAIGFLAYQLWPLIESAEDIANMARNIELIKTSLGIVLP